MVRNKVSPCPIIPTIYRLPEPQRQQGWLKSSDDRGYSPKCRAQLFLLLPAPHCPHCPHCLRSLQAISRQYHDLRSLIDSCPLRFWTDLRHRLPRHHFKPRRTDRSVHHIAFGRNVDNLVRLDAPQFTIKHLNERKQTRQGGMYCKLWYVIPVSIVIFASLFLFNILTFAAVLPKHWKTRYFILDGLLNIV